VKAITKTDFKKVKAMKFLIGIFLAIAVYGFLLSVPLGLMSIGIDMYYEVNFLEALLAGLWITLGMMVSSIFVLIFTMGLACIYIEYRENGTFEWLWDYFEHKEKG
jgi:protein-S-isoprenylcysteine O-methyltransferase Ste14